MNPKAPFVLQEVINERARHEHRIRKEKVTIVKNFYEFISGFKLMEFEN